MPDFNELLESIQSQAKTYDSNYLSDNNQSQSISLVTPKQEQLSFNDYTPFKKETVYADLSSGERVAMFENYIPGTNNEERLAQTQSTGDKWANGALKFGAKTFNAIIGGTLGVVNGVGEGLSGGSVYDNDFSNWLADLDTKLNYQLPNYYTEQEKNAGTFSQMGSANFWADKFLGGLSFTAGAVVSEGIWAWATGGTSLATTGARLGARGASLFGKATKVGAWGLKNLDEATTIAGMSKYRNLLETVPGKMYQAGTIGKNTALALGKTGELVSTAGFAIRSAGYEASVEALQYKREAEENFYSNFAELNGREPSIEETTEFQKNLNDSANAVFTANMAIVGASNIVTMGHILDIKNPINLGIGKFIDRKAFGYGLDKATGEVLKSSAKQKIARNVFDFVIRPGFTEGLFEEGLQGTTTKTANRWIEHTYNPKHTADNFNTIDAMKESLSEQYGSQEGWKENMLGILVGVVGGSVNTYQGQKNKAKDLEFEASVGQMYKPEGQTLQSALLGFKIQSANRTQAFAQEAKEEAQKGNITKSTLANESSVLNMINARQVLGDSNSQIVTRTKESLDLIKPEQWLEMGVEVDQIEQEKNDRIKRVSELADQWKTNKKYVQYMLGNKLVGEDALGETALETSTNTQFNKNAALVEAMTWTLTTGENSQKHMLDAQKVFSRELGQEKTKVLDIISQKEQLKKETQVELNKLTKQHSLLSKKRDVLTKKIAKLDAQPKLTDQNKKGLQPRVALTEQLLELETQLTEVTNGLEVIAEDLNSANDYNKGLNDVNLNQDISKPLITGQDLIDLETNTVKFRNSIEAFSSTNPQKYQYLIDVLDEYGQAKAIFMQSQASHKAFVSKDFKLQNVGSWIGGKMSKNKKMSENTSEWLNDVLKTYTEYKAEGLREEQEVEVTPTVEVDKKEAVGKTQEQINQDKIDELENERLKELSSLQDKKQVYELGEVDGDFINLSQFLTDYNLKEDFNFITDIFEDKKIKVSFDGKHAGGLPSVASLDRAIINNRLNIIFTVNKENFNKKNLEEKKSIVAHEMVHGLIALKLNEKGSLNDKNFYKGLNSIFTDAKTFFNSAKSGQNLKNRDILQKSFDIKELTDIEGKLNYIDNEIEELATLGLTDLTFIKFLKLIESDKSVTIQENLWTKLVNVVGEFIGISNNKFTELLSFIQTELDIETTNSSSSKENIKNINEKYDKRIKEVGSILQNQIPKTKIEIYKDKIKKALEMYDFTPIAGSYEDVVLQEPTQAEVDEYITLKKEEKNNSLFSERLRELTNKLSNWKLLNSTIDDENASIVETLALIEQLERKVEQEQTKVELTQEDIQNLSSPIEGVNNINDYGLGINANASVTVQRPAGLDVYRFSHMSVEEMAKRVGAETIIIDNEVVSPNTKPKIDKNIVINGIEFVYRPQGKLELKISDYDQASLMFNFIVVDTGAVTWSYSDVYTKKGEDVVKLDSMFFDDIDSSKAFNLKPGDKLKLVVNNTDGFNTEKSTEKEFKIFLQDKNGNRIQTLKASRELGNKDIVNEPFLQLRNEAFKRWVAEGRPDKTDLGIEVEVENIFMGSPEIKLDGDFNFTERATTEVLATGYIQDGKATLSREIPEINYTYVGKLKNGLKNPIVIIKKGAYNVAFPISVIRKVDSKINELNGILNSSLSPQEKTLKINDLIVENSIEHLQIGFSELESESLKIAFENNESYTTAEEFADKKYKKENLVQDATIKINLENLDRAISDVKVRFNLETISYKVPIETKNDNLTEVENSLNDLALELYKDYTTNASTTYLDSKGNILEDTTYTDALDEEVREPKSQLDKIRNINLLIQAFSQKLPKIVEQALGAEKIKEVKGLIKQYTFIKKQITPKEEIKKDICT